MTRHIFSIAVRVALVGMFAGAIGSFLVAPQTRAIANPISTTCSVDSSSPLCTNSSEKLFGPNSVWTKIVNTLIYITGAISVIMIVIGGMRFTLSGGDAAGTKSGRETVIYAVIGLAVAIMSYAIVNFVLSRL